MQQVIFICLAAMAGLFVGILFGKGSAERKKVRADRKAFKAMEAKQPKAISMSNYKRSS